MSALTPWSGTESLPTGATLLIEASAGTGKTWQIEGLVVRLVAEFEVPIDQILVITFTKAATSELRDRIRARLVKARQALESTEAVDDDPILYELCRDDAARTRRRDLIAMALSSFDLAPISTIHGFSQSMLEQMAFESGQQPGLELLADPAPLLMEFVDDELARLYSEATLEDLDVLEDMGWTRDSLMKIARDMTGAVAPTLVPASEAPDLHFRSVLDRWMEEKNGLLAWLESPEGESSIEALRRELTPSRKGVLIESMRANMTVGRVGVVKDWLSGPGLRKSRLKKGTLNTSLTNLQIDYLEDHWVGDRGSMRAFGGYALFEKVNTLLQFQDTLWPKLSLSFAARIRGQLDGELKRRGYLTYGAMLSRLSERIEQQASEEGASRGRLAHAIRERFQVALIDEFQDTDGAQWSVMKAVFAHLDRRLLLIGDPKQAIYAFRGADVHVYLQARHAAKTKATMVTNWRSDAAYVHAMNHLWSAGSDVFELEKIDYLQVAAAPANAESRIRNLPHIDDQRLDDQRLDDQPRAALSLRWVDNTTLGAEGMAISSKEAGIAAITKLVSQETARLLSGNAEILTKREGQEQACWSALQPRDIAVLVRTNSQATQIREEMRRRGIPAITAARGSVYESPVVGWICAWLEALVNPSWDRPARALVTTPLFGWTANDLSSALAEEDETITQHAFPQSPPAIEATGRWRRWLEDVRDWSSAWQRHGFVRVFERSLDQYGVIERLLSSEQGERQATDLRHLVQLCHTEERRTRVGPSGLAAWLRACQLSEGKGDDSLALQLESDARAVQLITVHTSKGLEYPVVLLPFAWEGSASKDKGQPILYHGRMDGALQPSEPGVPRVSSPLDGRSQTHPSEAQPRRLLSLHAKDTPGRAEALRCREAENGRESLRLLYVALTRAKHHCVAWLGPIGKEAYHTGASALGKVVLRARDSQGIPLPEADFPIFESSTSKKADIQAKAVAASGSAWEEVQARLKRLADTSGGQVSWSHEPPLTRALSVALAPGKSEPLRPRTWPHQRGLDTCWQVSSYSAMVGGRTFDADEPARLDELRSLSPSARSDHGSGSQVRLSEPNAGEVELDTSIATADLPGGTEVGIWTHSVLEHLDFQACSARGDGDLMRLISELGIKHGIDDPENHERLAAALPALLDTPLSASETRLPTGFCLRQLADGDRLDELAFDLKLGDANRYRADAPGSEGRLNHRGASVALASRLGDLRWGGDDWLRALLDQEKAERPVLPSIAGLLTGFIDLTFRVSLDDGIGRVGERYYVADYKTNRIASPNARGDSRWLHYTHGWMAWEMAHHGYHLQSLLYTVALHRMLQLRLADYDYERHVGGHLYLFLRGMGGPSLADEEQLPLGVYFDRWPASVVLGLDAALSGASTDRVRSIVDSSARPTTGSTTGQGDSR